MYHKWLSTISLLLIALFGSTLSVAQSVNAEQAKLAGFEQQLAELQTRQQQWQSELSEKKAQLQPLLNQESPEKTDLDAAQKNLDKAAADYKTDPSAENKAMLNNIEFKYALAERKFKKAYARLFALEQAIKERSTQIATASNDISALTISISEQRRAVDKARFQQLAGEQARREQEQKRQAEADASEIARLKAQLERQKRDEQARMEAAALAAKTAAAATTTPATVAEPIPPTSTSLQTTTAVTTTPSSPPATVAATKNAGAFLLNTKEQVQAEEQRLKKWLATPNKSRNSRSRKVFKVKAITTSGTIKRAKSTPLRALGHDQYRGSARLTAGKAIFLIGSNTWRQEVPDTAKNNKYTVIFDNSDSKNPRLVYYPASLGQ